MYYRSCMSPLTASTSNQILRHGSQELELAVLDLPNNRAEMRALLRGTPLTGSLHIPPCSQARVQEILTSIVSAWNSARAVGAAFCMDSLHDGSEQQLPGVSLEPRDGLMRISLGHFGALPSDLILEGSRLVRTNSPAVEVIRPEVMALLRQAWQQCADFRPQIAAFVSQPTSQFQREGKFYHLVRGSGPGALHTVVEEVSISPPIRERSEEMRRLIAEKFPKGNLKERLEAALSEPAVHFVTLYTSDLLGNREINLPRMKDLALALEARGQGQRTRAYRLNFDGGISDSRAYEPGRGALMTGFAPGLENFVSIEEALAVLTSRHDLPRVLPRENPEYESIAACADIACESAADQYQRYISLRGKSNPILAGGSPVAIPPWLTPHMAAPADKQEQAVVHDYRRVPCNDGTNEDYGASMWRWRLPPFLMGGVKHSLQYEVRWHTKVSNVLDQAYPAFVVTRTVFVQTDSGEHKRVMGQVLLNCDSRTPGLERLRILGAQLSSYTDGSVWIDEASKRSAHGALLEMRRTRAESPVAMTEELVERTHFAEAVNSLVHHAYFPEYDPRNTYWVIQSHRLAVTSLRMMREGKQPPR